MSKEKYIECIDNLFLKLELAYHYQFYKVFGTDDRLNEGKKLWAISLKSFSPEIIIEATQNVIGAQSYLPTLTDFIKACSEINSHNGFPSVEEAFIEARKSYPPRTEYPWSHPIVYFSGKKIGWNFLERPDFNSRRLLLPRASRFATVLLGGALVAPDHSPGLWLRRRCKTYRWPCDVRSRCGQR